MPDHVLLELPGGRTVSTHVLPLRRGVELAKDLAAAQAGDPDAHLRILDELPAALGVEEEALTPGELFALAHAYVRHVRSPVPAAPPVN